MFALVVASAVLAVGCASDDGGPNVDALPFVGGAVTPPDLSQALGPAGESDALGLDDLQSPIAQRCEDGEFRACDDLYQRGQPDSTFASYAFSCGGRLQPPPAEGAAPNCRLRQVGHVPVAAGVVPTGDSPTLDRLAQECAQPSGLEACDTLYRESPQGNDYIDFGITCGFRTPDTRPNACAGFDGIPNGRPPAGVTGDAELDQLADECYRGRLSSCDELYASSDRGSLYETYAQTCGRRLVDLVEADQPTCDLRFNDPVPTYPGVAPTEPLGDDPRLDALVDQCAEGTMAACDELFARSELNTEYENFGATCGRRFAARRENLQFSAAGECDARVNTVPEGTPLS